MDRIVSTLAAALAILGGLVLSALIVMTSISISGRAFVAFGLGPVPGDFEIVEAGVAFAIFSFLPWCQLNAGHATVDVFTSQLSARANRWLIAFWEVAFTIMVVLIAWRLFEGMTGKFRNGQTSMFIQFPIWWAYAACMFAASIGVLVGIWTAWMRIRDAHRGTSTKSQSQETA